MIKKLTTFSKTVLILSVLKVIFILSLVLSLMLWSIPFLSFNSDIWSVFQKRSDVVLDQNDNIENYNDLMVDFFVKGVGLDFLNEKEFSHLVDVRNVIIITNIVFIASLIIMLSHFRYLSKSHKEFLIKATRKTSLFVFVFTAVLSTIILSNFYSSFLAFHKVLFVRNFIFPADSILKILYPDQFFYGLSALYLLSIMLVSLAVTIFSHRLKLK